MKMVTKRILIVDDEEGYRKVLSNSLSNIGFETTVATNGVEALEAMKEKNYTVILLDMKMPGMDGIELLEQINKASDGSNIVIITAYTCKVMESKAIGKGARKVIRKPFSMEDITLCLNEIIDF
ncbi:hypothetical protein SCALIN_C24_0039 [Candidatus Scalindua japonica]|uniref:Response regulatory domain-containing protein n=1 Tax=Candidatus Scalindua japonica TaxID=1284222 RepID=A0A286U076_9BACT|nr:response regulator [Candidatus Scalindua japonica]GAX61540.1 hypothetical protein SCALIN_C24_0039 [Candidatus Scalindua japonica]